jgi:glyoxylase-like metal-dependent hydrolase (beta-lactamase superfamily II)
MLNEKSYQIGNMVITCISELLLKQTTPAELFPNWNSELLSDSLSWLPPGTMDETHQHVILSVHSWLIRTPRHVILIDTGVGSNKNRPFTPAFHQLSLPYLDKLQALGVKPENVDYVLMTHLHVDHVGWNTCLKEGNWVPTFPNARYVFSKTEYEYYNNPINHIPRNKTSVIAQQDSIIPLIQAGLADMIAVDGSEWIDGLSFMPTAGHSIDHATISLSSCGQEALFIGDLLHHPLQVRYPNLNSIYDTFSEQAIASRLWVLEYASRRKPTIFCSHFPNSSVGTVTHDDQKFHWSYI